MGYYFLLRVPREYNKRKKIVFISQMVLEKLHICTQKALLTIAKCEKHPSIDQLKINKICGLAI